MDAEDVYRSPPSGADPERAPPLAEDGGRRVLAGAAVGQAGLGLWALGLGVGLMYAARHAPGTWPPGLRIALGLGELYSGLGLGSLVVAGGLLRAQRWACWGAVGLASTPLLATLVISAALTSKSGLDVGLVVLLVGALVFAGYAVLKAKRLLSDATRAACGAGAGLGSQGWLRPSLQDALREGWPDLGVAALSILPASFVVLALQMSDR